MGKFKFKKLLTKSDKSKLSLVLGRDVSDLPMAIILLYIIIYIIIY